jgi:hypothetical protein
MWGFLGYQKRRSLSFGKVASAHISSNFSFDRQEVSDLTEPTQQLGIQLSLESSSPDLVKRRERHYRKKMKKTDQASLGRNSDSRTKQDNNHWLYLSSSSKDQALCWAPYNDSLGTGVGYLIASISHFFPETTYLFAFEELPFLYPLQSG